MPTDDRDSPLPLVVDPSAAQTVINTAIGQIVQAVGGVLLAYGVFTPQHWAAIAAAVPICVGAAWRIYAAAANHKQLVLTARAAPDNVAVVAPKEPTP